ncbi:hypothetical protein Bbelb_200330 [Branchiostoma belcheri]|nr:hypothetical protein Bbelb_200330 [Branchiostoma belcheri]
MSTPPSTAETRITLGEEPRQVAHSKDTGVMNIPVSSSREDVNTGESDDTPEAHVSHHGGRDTNTPRQIGDTKKEGEHATDIEAENTLSVTVGRNIIGLVGNKMYGTDSNQQAGHGDVPTTYKDGGTETVATEDYDYDPDSHVYHYADEDDINNVLQSDQGNGNVGHPNDTAVPNNSRKGASYLRHNPVYQFGALSQDNNKESTFLHPYLLRGIIIVAVAVFVSVVANTVFYLTRPLGNSKNLTMESPPGAYSLDLTTTSLLVKMTTGPALPELKTSIHEFMFPATSVTRGMDAVTKELSSLVVTNKTSPAMRAVAKNDGCQVGYKRLASTCCRLHFRRMTWFQAREACKKEGARLAMPKTEELDIALRNLVRTEGQNENHWIGLRDKERRILWKKRWVWDDGDGIQESQMAVNGIIGSNCACSTGQVPLVTPCGMIIAAVKAVGSSAKHL